MNALDMIAAERADHGRRGFTNEHDDEHTDGEIAWAAAEFAMPGYVPEPGSWAFSRNEHSRLEQLAKAGALIVAEMERIMRAQAVEEQISSQSA